MYRIEISAVIALDVNSDGSVDGATVHVGPHIEARVTLDGPGALTADGAGELLRELYAPETHWPCPSWHVPPMIVPEIDARCDCEGGIVPGALWPWGGPDAPHSYVERCDDCRRFADDDEAAEAVARAVGGIVEHDTEDGTADEIRAGAPYVERPETAGGHQR